jgi:hypothetical protein
MTNTQHKILSTTIISVVTFLGFEALSILLGLDQLHAFITTAIYLFLFQIFWISFLFDLHLKDRTSVALSSAHFRKLFKDALVKRFDHLKNLSFLKHYLNYSVLPTIIYWSAIGLMYLNPFYGRLKQIILMVSTIVLTIVYWYMKKHLTSKLEASNAWIRALYVFKLTAVFLFYSAMIGLVFYFGLSPQILFYGLLIGTFLLIHQALYSYGYHSYKLLVTSLIFSLAISIVGIWVYRTWSAEYFTAGLVLLALYNTFWGLVLHYVERTFNSKIALEYFILLILVMSILLASHNFGTRVI